MFTNRPNYGYYSPKVDPPHKQVLVCSPKEAVAANDSLSLHRNVTARKNKRKRKSYAEFVKEKISERKGDKQKMLAVQYKKNDEKSSSINKVIRLVLNFLFFFFTVRFHKYKKALKRTQATKSTINILLFPG